MKPYLSPWPPYLLLSVTAYPVYHGLDWPLWWWIAFEVSLFWTLLMICDYVKGVRERSWSR